MPAIAPTTGRPSVLFLDKVFLKRPPEPLRGVELFNLNLLRDLVRLGFRCTLVAEASWEKPVREFLGDSLPACVWIPPCGPDVITALRAGWRLRRHQADCLFVGNVGNGLIPLLAWWRLAGVFGRAVLIAHREATPRFVRLFRRLPGWVVAVNGQIARPFREAGHPNVAVDYGIFHSERFAPPASREASPVRFVVLGALDNAWKGADTALAAFRLLSTGVRARCELHLASYQRPPELREAGVVVHPWMPASGIPGLLARMHVMVCPSRDEVVMRETFSQAMVQGMLSGLPILANDLPILVEKLDRGGGLVFRSVEELSGQMAALAGDAARRAELGAEARAVALERYVWDSARFARRYLAPEAGV